jgi:hypothetical protein
MLLLFYTGISLTLAMMFATLAVLVGLTQHVLFVGAIAFSICMIALCINAINQGEDD